MAHLEARGGRGEPHRIRVYGVTLPIAGTTSNIGTSRWRKCTIERFRIPFPTEGTAGMAQVQTKTPMDEGTSVIGKAYVPIGHLTEEERQHTERWRTNPKTDRGEFFGRRRAAFRLLSGPKA